MVDMEYSKIFDDRIKITSRLTYGSYTDTADNFTIRFVFGGNEMCTVGNSETRRLGVPRPVTRVDNNDHKSNEDSRACAALCFRGGFQPGQRAVRSRGYNRGTRDLLIGRIANVVNMGRLRSAGSVF